jgi:hypothetical protein
MDKRRSPYTHRLDLQLFVGRWGVDRLCDTTARLSGSDPSRSDPSRSTPSGRTRFRSSLRILAILVFLWTVLPAPSSSQRVLRSVGEALPAPDLRSGEEPPVQTLPLSWTGSLVAETMLGRSFLGSAAFGGGGLQGTILSHAGSSGEAKILGGPALHIEWRGRALTGPQWVVRLRVGADWSLYGSWEGMQPTGTTLTTDLGLAPPPARSPVVIERIEGGPAVRAGVPAALRAVVRGPDARRAQIRWEFESGGIAFGRSITRRFHETGPAVITCTAATSRGVDVAVHRLTVLAR